MKREATAVGDHQEPPVKKHKAEDDQEVATSSMGESANPHFMELNLLLSNDA